MAPKSTPSPHSSLPRRSFLALSATALAAPTPPAAITILLAPNDPIASAAPVRWAATHLAQTLHAKHFPARIVHSPAEAASASRLIVPQHNPKLPTPESFTLAPTHRNGTPATTASAAGPRGAVYALLELADRVEFSPDPLHALTLAAAIEEHPANEIRSINRAFSSEIEDKPWFYDESFWRSYLTLLATHRFNRFNFTLGLGYDFPKGVTGDYLHFPYPYLLDVPGYNVRAVPLTPAERGRNLHALQFIARETAARGLHFQLGIWTHAYQWTDSPNARHRIEGLTPATHAAYCRDALALLLHSCPEIQGLTLRVHGESGIPEGSYSFWQTVFEGIRKAGRPIEIDMHAKGVDQKMIDIALATGMPVKLSPKYWAEHMGPGYHQASIRELEMPRQDSPKDAIFALSNGARRFLRYGYGDLFTRDRSYGVLFRLWPGTQRVLLWGDPVTAAAYGRSSRFCLANGMDICEPLYFKGREGSGTPGGRCAYSDASLNPSYDFEKFTYSYRLWGRLLYNPNADPDSWQRYLRTTFGPAAAPLASALSHASRTLPLVTAAHLPSASNHSFWPEMNTNMPIVAGSEPTPYSDTPKPVCFATVSPLDPEMFSSVLEHVNRLIDGRWSPKYSPIEVAQWLDEAATLADSHLNAASAALSHAPNAEFRRAALDIAIQIGLARFFAAKMRAAAWFELYRQTSDRGAAARALAEYRAARQAWAALAASTQNSYRSDITYGRTPERRLDWSARLAAIDTDLHAMEAALTAEGPLPNPAPSPATPIARFLAQPHRSTFQAAHTPPASFQPGSPLPLTLTVAPASARSLRYARLHYRRVNQAERWQTRDMQPAGATYTASIPATYSNSPYALQYYFELGSGTESPTLIPGFNPALSNQPYYVVQQS
jgi:hypothetical protein